MISPQISVVLPFKNASRWLPVCLASIAQEWPVPFELIAINDHSTDGSVELIEKLCFHWPQWKYKIVDSDGSGVSEARNKGMAISSAPLIAFMDADDRALAGRLSGPLQLFQNHPDLDHVHGGWWCFGHKKHLLHIREPWREGADFNFESVLNHKAVLPSSWTIRRSVLENVGGFDCSLSQAEDVDLLLRISAKQFKGAWFQKPLVRYRLHPAGASRNISEQIKGLMKVIDRHLVSVPANEAKEYYYATLSWCVWLAWWNNNYKTALNLVAECSLRCPWPPVRRPVHLLEVFARSCARISAPFDRIALIKSSFWARALALLQP